MLKTLMGGTALALALVSGLATAALSTVALADETVHVTGVDITADGKALNDQIVADYEAAHPGTKVVFDSMENEAFKAKLPTMLQSKDAPSAFYTWTGGVMRAQVQAGFVRPIDAADLPPDGTSPPATVKAFQVDGKTYGSPQQQSGVAFFYNKALMAKAGVDPTAIKTWDDLLAAVKTIKAAGITPLIVGAGDKWPMHFYWSYLALRAGGGDILDRARAGQDGGFNGPAFVEAGKRLKELADLQPFQPGFQGTLHMQAAGLFGDGKGAMTLMGNWLIPTQKGNAADGKGIAPGDIGILSFPTLPDGKGKATDVLGGINGYLVSKDAPKATADFLKFMTQLKYQKIAAAKGIYIPTAVGSAEAIADPATKEVATMLGRATAFQIFFDQDLGPSVGRTVNDVSVAIAAGQMSPEDAAKAVQDAWDEQ